MSQGYSRRAKDPNSCKTNTRLGTLLEEDDKSSKLTNIYKCSTLNTSKHRKESQ